MTTRVWFENDAIQMEGVDGALPARSLTTALEGDRVHIFTLSGTRLAQLAYGEYARKDGSGFTSAADAKAYLDGEFAKVPAITVTWSTLSGKPNVFPPAAHTHLWADITDRPTIPAATPLGTANPQALGTAAPGSSANASREDHVHPLPSGRLQLIGTYSVGEVGLVTLALAVRRYSLTATGVTTADRIVATLNGVPQNGSLQDVYVSAANTLSVGALVPTLGVATTVAIPIAVYKVV